MKKFFLSLVVLGLGVLSMAQDSSTVVRRIKIRYADPHLIMLLLSGATTTNTAPETSVIQNTPKGNGGFGGSGFGGGQGGSSGGNGGFGGRGFGGGN